MRLHQRSPRHGDPSPAPTTTVAATGLPLFECACGGRGPVRPSTWPSRGRPCDDPPRLRRRLRTLRPRPARAREIDDELPDARRPDRRATDRLCEALLAAGDVASAAGAVSQLQEPRSFGASRRHGDIFDRPTSMLIHLSALRVEARGVRAAAKLAERTCRREAKAHTRPCHVTRASE